MFQGDETVAGSVRTELCETKGDRDWETRSVRRLDDCVAVWEKLGKRYYQAW